MIKTIKIKPEVAARAERTGKKSETVAVIGLGYVGLPLALIAAKKGYEVFGIDINKEKVELVNSGKSPFKDELAERELKAGTTMKAFADFAKVKESDIVVICVPTPVYENHMPDLRPVEGACRGIAPFVKKGQLIILESTVNPGVCDDIVIPILEKETNMKAGVDFYVAHCPERINPGDPKYNVENINRVVGSLEEKGLKMALDFYGSIITGTIKPMGSLKEAESVKVVENSFRDINIAFVNELAMSFAKLGIDIVNVINGCATKPFAFMAHYPGCGVGGHCIPVDPYYLIEYAKEKGFEHDFLRQARRINNHMPKFTVEQAIAGLNEKKKAINGAKVAVLGLAYKAGIDDSRESPSFEIIKHLKAVGANVASYDPFVLKQSTTQSLDEALDGAVAVIVATNHKMFKEMTPDYLKRKGAEVVVDGRNCLNKEDFTQSGIVYKGIGR
ncbi:MAG: nucleotide sugar dehydrogenase [Candidatus Paceibacter sp.]|nr:nucleotide sugar dehydrogenase [Candidatus Paceibacter sp.]